MKFIVSRFLTAFLLCGLVAFTSSFNLNNLDTVEQFDPVKKLDWILPFYPLSKMLTMDHWEKNPSRSFDKNGVILDNGKYHPVNIFQYGIACYDMFKKTNEISYKKKVINQANYLLDSSNYATLANNGIGFPYKINFRDLTPDWYSGLAQGEGIMFILRYYELTKDKSLLPILQRIKKFMLTPVSEGGTLLIEDNNRIWIEEYPNSKQKTHVLNGFITAITSLYEYCKVFPDDKKTQQVLDGCIRNLKYSIKTFDTGSWVYYDNGTEHQAEPNWYMKTNVFQMELLFDYTKDDFFKTYQMLWATYSYNHNISGMIGCIVNDYNFSIPVEKKDNGWYYPVEQKEKVNLTGDILNVSITNTLDSNGIAKIIDNNINSLYAIKQSNITDEELSIIIKLKHEISSSEIKIDLVDSTIDLSGIKLFIDKTKKDKWKKVKLLAYDRKRSTYSFNFEEKNFYAYKIVLPRTTFKNGIKELSLFKRSLNVQKPMYAHFMSDPIEVKDKIIDINFTGSQINDFIIFYKTASTKTELIKTRWNEQNILKTIPARLSRKENYYQFLLVCENNSSKTSFKNISFQK